MFQQCFKIVGVFVDVSLKVLTTVIIDWSLVLPR